MEKPANLSFVSRKIGFYLEFLVKEKYGWVCVEFDGNVCAHKQNIHSLDKGEIWQDAKYE